MAKTVKAAKVNAGIKDSGLSKPSAKKEPGAIKYDDKSAGQPDLVIIFNELREVLLLFGKETRLTQKNSGGQVHLISEKPMEVQGKKRAEMYFASLLVQKGYVGFYFMPASVDGFVKKNIDPELLKLLKGKTCFHIKKLDDWLKGQVREALEAGYKYFEEEGWA